MDIFWIIIGLIFLVGFLGYLRYRNPQVDVHEGNLTETQFRLWSVWLSGLFMFLLGYHLDKPWIQTSTEDGSPYPLWINYAIFGIVIFYFACMFALPKLKKGKKDK